MNDRKRTLPLLILPIETKVREFHGKMFFSYLVALRGGKIIVGEQEQLWRYADLFPPGVYIDKSVAATRIDWFRQLEKAGHQVVSWDEEGLIYFSAEVYQKLRLTEETLKRAELFFCWGECQKEAVVANFPQFRDKVHVCGNPRFDLLRKEYRAIFQPGADALTKKYGSILLINTNFSFFNHFRSKNQLKSMLACYPLAKEKSFMDGWMRYHEDGFNAFRDLLPALSKKYSDHTIVIRPHPSENHEIWSRLTDHFANVVVNAQGNVHEWILASDLLLHDNCTTAVEAFILGVAPFNFRKKRLEQYDNFLPRILSHCVTTKEELLTGFDKALAGDESFRQMIWSEKNSNYLNYYVSGFEKATSVDIMLNRISETFPEVKSTIAVKERLLNGLKLHWRNQLNRYRERVVRTDGYSQQKFSGINSSEIIEIFRSFDKLTKQQNRFTVRKITKNIYSVCLRP
ncbi:MAG: hypothetical protein D3919_14885 [Candidatus Electrothrix sp. AW5]|nr:hypothetical protein [Candidatus Electrothrix gigas]